MFRLLKYLVPLLLFCVEALAAAQAATSQERRWQNAIADDDVATLCSSLREWREREALHGSKAHKPTTQPEAEGAANNPDAGTPASLATLSDKTGRTALMVASKHGNLALAKELLVMGADVQAGTATGGTSFMFAILGNQQKTARWLLGQGADSDAAGSNGWTAAMIAAAKGYADTLQWLISMGVDFNRADVYGFTPLMRAVDNQHVDTVAVLLATPGIVLDAQDEAGNTALHHAAASGKPVLFEQLAEAGAPLDVFNRLGQSAAMLKGGSLSPQNGAQDQADSQAGR